MSKRIFIDDQEMINKADFDNKVNVDGPIYRTLTKDQNKTMAGITGQAVATGAKVLVSFRDNSYSADKTEAHNGSGIAFGGDDTAVAISVPGWGEHLMKVYWSNGKPETDWTEYVAWKSDIDALKQEISDLKKQIGGVTSHLHARLIDILATSTEMEAA